jgi:hypothetical protein
MENQKLQVAVVYFKGYCSVLLGTASLGNLSQEMYKKILGLRLGFSDFLGQTDELKRGSSQAVQKEKSVQKGVESLR